MFEDMVLRNASLPLAANPSAEARLVEDPLAARVERALEAAVGRARGRGCPPRLAEALGYAVFPGGARLRPQLCLMAAVASGDGRPAVADSAAAAVELLHCASLVHDDLPCFDDAPLRRGKPTVHAAYGAPTAVLAGDALIVLAFEELGRAAAAAPELAGELIATLARAAGAGGGITGGQAWEQEPAAPLDEYHRAKTAVLFEAAAALGALSGGADPAPWRAFGERIGLAYQAADDLADTSGEAAALGKPVGRDAALDRPNLVRGRGARFAYRRLGELIAEASDRVPPGARADEVRAWLARLVARLGGR